MGLYATKSSKAIKKLQELQNLSVSTVRLGELTINCPFMAM